MFRLPFVKYKLPCTLDSEARDKYSRSFNDLGYVPKLVGRWCKFMGDQAKGFFNNILASAAWDGIKRGLGCSLVTALGTAIWEKLKHGSLDWLPSEACSF